MSSKRIGRISEEIRKIASDIIRNQLKDPGISSLTSITEVEVTRDLSYAKIYVSVLGNEKERRRTIKALEKSAGFVRREIGRNLKLRHIPEINFYLDKSIENGIYMSKLIDNLKNNKNESNE